MKRELRMREVTYPRWVNAPKPKLTPAKAEQELARMRAVLESLDELGRLRPVVACLREAVMRDWNAPAATCSVHFRDEAALLEFMTAFDQATSPAWVPSTSAAPAVPQ